MSENFAPRSIKVLHLANQEAQCHDRGCIGTEDVLIGILQGSTSITEQVLRNFGVSEEKIRQERERLPPENVPSTPPQMAHLRLITEYAKGFAKNLEHQEVCPIHLLLGIIKDKECNAFAILTKLGIEPEVLGTIAIKAYQSKIEAKNKLQ